METIIERPAGLDVHKAQVTACVRVPDQAGGRAEHVAEFPTTVRGLLTLRDWLAAHRVSQVTMEATGVYWKPVWAVLEDEFALVLVNARHVKQVPGRKTDVTDAAWLCRLAEAGLLRASFVPPKPIRALRNLTRYRKTQIQERAREANRLHKAWRTPASSSTAWPRTSSAPPGGPCSGRSSRAPPTPRSWPSRPGAACGPSCPPCARPWRAASTACTPSGSGPSWPTSTSWMSRSTGSRTPSRSRSPLSPRRCACCAPSPALSGARPR